MRHPKKPTVPYTKLLIEEFYSLPGNEAGGVLHTVLDDGNIGKSHIKYALEMAKDRDDCYAIDICERLLLMSESQKRRLLRSRFR